MTGGKAISSDSGRLYDELLVTLLQAGDRQAGERLVARWQPRFARSARRLLGSEEAALGAVQDSWVSILRGIGGLRDPARFAPWAFGILRRRCMDHLRHTMSARHDPEEECTQVPVPAQADDAVAIKRAFAALPHDQRFAAQLYFVEGLTLAEIASAQAVPVGTAKSRLFHARRTLKAALSGDDT